MAVFSSVLPKLALTLPPQVSHEPVGVEGVLRRHAPPHDGVEEGFPLARIEAQNLFMSRHCLGQNEGEHFNSCEKCDIISHKGCFSLRGYTSCLPQYCPQLVPARAAKACPCHSSGDDENVCAHLWGQRANLPDCIQISDQVLFQCRTHPKE